MKKFRAVIGVLLCMLVLLPSGARALAADETQSAFPAPLRLVANENGLAPHLETADGNTVAAMDSKTGLRRAPANLPAAYDSRSLSLVTPVKNQDSSGICWAFGAVSALETSAVKQGLADVNTVDYSESHLAWFGVNSATTNTADLTYGDGTSMSFRDTYASGGNSLMAVAALSRGVGAANEADFNFERDYYNNRGYDEKDRYVSVMHLASSNTLDCFDNESAAALRQDVKQAILDNGSVTASYYASFDQLYHTTSIDGVTSTAYYQKRVSKPELADHMITIVGWDDNYSVAHFDASARPSAPGAWLVKNSWGETFDPAMDAVSLTDGYMYLSYEEPSLCELVSFTAMPADAYDGIYQYDGYGYAGCLPFEAKHQAAYANIFTATENAMLTKVGFYTALGNEAVDVYVYNHLSDGTNPESGTLVCKLSASYRFAGYHTLDLTRPAALRTGERFSVVIKAPEGKSLSVPAEINFIGSRYYSAHAGESFISAAMDSAPTWYAAGDFSNRSILLTQNYTVCNVPIKAMTTAEEKHTHIWSEPETIKATCTAYGGTARTCSACDAVEYLEQTAPTGHRDDNGDYICDNCGISLRPANACPYCDQVHGGGFDQIVAFFHRILFIFKNLFRR